MSRFAKILTLAAAALSVAVATAACGTEKISVPKSAGDVYRGAVLFNERCAGCHTLSYAATNGSAPNIRTASAVSGPNFNERCERPIDRVLYAIENGGFSGAYMPQNVVVGQDAIDVAKFVATYAGREAPRQTGVPPCQEEAIGTLPPGSGTIAAGSQPTATTAQAATITTGTATTVAAVVVHKRGPKRSAKK
jgi:cytochrome c